MPMPEKIVNELVHGEYRMRLTCSKDEIIISYDDTPVEDMRKIKPGYEHTHEFYEIEYILSGSGMQIINGERYDIKKGDVIFICPNDTHVYCANDDCEEFGIINCVFQNIPAGFEKKGAMLPCVISLKPTSIVDIDSIFLKMQAEYTQEQMGWQDALAAYLNLIFVTILRESRASVKAANKFQANIAMLLDYIEENYQSLTLQDCANFVSYSPNYFCRLFKDNVGMTLTEYLNKKKIQAVMEQLIETERSVEFILQDVGFNQRKYFYSLFRSYTGMSPTEFRRRNRNAL